uniref:Golgi SNAP receptor complex member 1 n=1 Tax=Biomphalaria glabrata TaxID=6526 RepID=A0A2C9K4Z8_BIOGL
MVEYTQNISTTSPSAALLHTLQRHRDILQDYSHEFQKTKANITAMREREDLLGSVRRDINAYKNSSALNRRSDMYLKEHEHIRNSERLVDEQISIAIATKENLQSQSKFLNSINMRKTKANITAMREREDLLGSVRRDINAYKNSSALNRRSDMYLKEHEHIRNSERLVDEQISIAIATKENLQSQSKFLNSINMRVNAVANRFPVINSLVQRINFRKRRDSIILGLVIAVCIILLILYAFH